MEKLLVVDFHSLFVGKFPIGTVDTCSEEHSLVPLKEALNFSEYYFDHMFVKELPVGNIYRPFGATSRLVDKRSPIDNPFGLLLHHQRLQAHPLHELPVIGAVEGEGHHRLASLYIDDPALDIPSCVTAVRTFDPISSKLHPQPVLFLGGCHDACIIALKKLSTV